MIEYARSYGLLKACIEDILSTIKPVEEDKKKRLCAIEELADSIYSVGPLRGIGYKHFSSFDCVSSDISLYESMRSDNLIEFVILEKGLGLVYDLHQQ